MFWPTTLALLTFLGAVQVLSSLRESDTADEPVELAAGYSYLKLGDFRMSPDHPPLTRMLNALPLLPFQPALPPDPASWSHGREFDYGVEFFRANGDRMDFLLRIARLPSILLTLLLGLAIALWARTNFGPLAALLALTLYAFDPAITAHGHYVKNDVSITLFAFLFCIAWGAFLKEPSRRRLVWAGLALGLAIATKFSAVFLIPVAAILYAIRWWQGDHGFSWRRALGSAAALVALAAGVVFVIYALPVALNGTHLGGIDQQVTRDLFDRSEAGVVARMSTHGPLRVHPLLEGSVRFFDHNSIGHPSYLLGMYGMKGWWYYFPIAFVVKMPLATLLLLAIAAVIAIRVVASRNARCISFAWFVMAVPLMVYGAMSVASHLNIGIRHLLPIWPFVFVLGAAGILRARFRYARALLVALIAGLVVESLSIFPHYLAFFNVAAGGPARGPAILADSNIDWGQDAKNLSAWLREHPAQELCIDYFGTADLDRLGLRGESLLGLVETKRRDRLDCVAAISVNVMYGLHGSFANPGKYAWLRKLQPAARVGYSIYVYDFSKKDTLAPLGGLSGDSAAEVLEVRHQDSRGVLTARDPARPGEIASIFMKGLGPVTAPMNGLRYTLLPVACAWNGVPAELTFAGLSPQRASVYQANVRVPAVGPVAGLTCGPALAFLGPPWSASIDVAVASSP